MSHRDRIGISALAAMLAACSTLPAGQAPQLPGTNIGTVEIRSVPVPNDIIVSSATYTPSGAVLVEYAIGSGDDPRQIGLATVADDGSGFRPFFAQRLPDRPLDNGIRNMVFPDNRRIFTGDFVIECSSSLETCIDPELLPVEYPAQIAGGEHIAHRWSEIIVGPDNRHIAWTTLLADFSSLVLTGELVREGKGYRIANSHVVSTIELTRPDPTHVDGVLPAPVRGGEVKQFVAGGTALSMAGMTGHDIPDSVVQYLGDGRLEAITSTPGYTETTIFSPDEKLGIVMTTRFSDASDPAVLGLLPRPYPDSLKMNLSMLAYTYAVTGVRRDRPGNIGPALIKIDRSKVDPAYAGINLSTDPEWVYRSPMSWHPEGRKAMWIEGLRDGSNRRIRIVALPDHSPGAPVAARAWPTNLTGSDDLSIIPSLARRDQNIDLRVYGKVSGHIDYRRVGGRIEKIYADFSDDGRHVYAGRERMDADPRAVSTYAADIDLVGEVPGAMHLQVTFGPLGGDRPARLDFAEGNDGRPRTRGFAQYGGRRLEIADLVP